jgi:hypothetical protein
MPTTVWNMLTRLSATNLGRRELAHQRKDLPAEEVPADQQPFIFIRGVAEGRHVALPVRSRHAYEREELDEMAVDPNVLYKYLQDNPELRGVARVGPATKSLVFGFLNHKIRALDADKE